MSAILFSSQYVKQLCLCHKEALLSTTIEIFSWITGQVFRKHTFHINGKSLWARFINRRRITLSNVLTLISHTHNPVAKWKQGICNIMLVGGLFAVKLDVM